MPWGWAVHFGIVLMSGYARMYHADGLWCTTAAPTDPPSGPPWSPSGPGAPSSQAPPELAARAGKGRAAGMQRSQTFEPPQS